MWLDADGSMDEKAVENLVENYLTHPEDVFIGSRFVPGGGYKGFDKDKKNDVTKVINRLLNSEESILAVTLSKYFNSLLLFTIKLSSGKLDVFSSVTKKMFEICLFFKILLMSFKKVSPANFKDSLGSSLVY